MPSEHTVVLIVGLTVVIIIAVISVRVLTGRKWRNRLPLVDKPND